MGFIILSSTLIIEHLLCKSKMSRTEFKRLVIIDTLYGVSAGLTLIAGVLLWFYVGNSDYYSHNWIFHLKITLFILVGLLSIYPTIFFLKTRKLNQETVQIPRKVIIILRIELLILLFIPLCAVFVTRGYG